MKLTSVTVEGVGRFGTKTSIEGLGAGVNILSASNEAGKSTIFRAIRACLFERHGATGKEIAKLATEGLSLPVSVTLGFEHGGKTYELAKTFIRSPSATLREDGRDIARGRDADERVWEILGLDPGGGRSVDEAAFGILWVRQGQSFHAPEPQGAAAGALNDAIGQEVGNLVGGERARQVIASVSAELSRQVTDSGKAKKDGPLDRAIRDVENLTGELQQTETRLRELDAMLDDLARLRTELKSVADPNQGHRLGVELEDARQQLKAAEEATQAIGRAAAEERQSHGLLQAATDRHTALLERAKRIDEGRQRIATDERALAPLKSRETDLRKVVNEAYEARKPIDPELARLDAEDRRLQHLATHVQTAASIDALNARLVSLTDYARRVSDIEARLKTNTVDERAIGILDDIEKKIGALDARLEAAAAQLAIEIRNDQTVTLNGETIINAATRAVTEPLTLRVGDGVTISITPPPGELATAQTERDKLDRTRHAHLQQHGVASGDELRRRRSERMSDEAEQRALKAERTALGIKDTPAAEISKLTAGRDQIATETAALLAAHGLEHLPSRGELDQRLQDLRQRKDALTVERTRHDGVIEASNDELQRVREERSAIEARIKEIANQLVQDLAALPDDQRGTLIGDAANRCETCRAEHRIKAAALEELRARAPSAEETERRRNRVERLAAALDTRRQNAASLGTRIANLEGRVQSLGGDGLGEEAATLRDQLAVAQTERDRQQARVDTLKLLRTVVQDAYDTRREQLNAPLKRHLKPFLHDVFPGSDIDLGDGFKVESIRRNGPGTEHFERLSAGTQEQIAVLVRLAMGAMIAEKGNEVPIILDDALVFSDDARIEQMFDALNRAGRRQQVIVFTCRAASFASLGGRPLSIA